jgi:lipopolysaccharide transport system permease protein
MRGRRVPLALGMRSFNVGFPEKGFFHCISRSRPMATSTLTASNGQRPALVIRATKGWAAPNLHELWRYRDLLLIFIQRELKLLYKQTALGAVWVVLQPLIAALIFAVIFGQVAKLPSDGAPYLLFVFCGLTVWTYFSQALQRAGNSLVQNAQLISKVYFPRLLIPLSRTLGPIVDFAVVFVVLLVLMAVYRYPFPGLRLVVIPGLLLLMICTATGVTLFFSALSVRYRDCAYLLPYVVQVWMYASPVIYPVSIVPAKWQPLFALNPAVGFIEGFRWAMLGRSAINTHILVITIIMSVLTLMTGLFFFRRVERQFADII